MRINEIKKDEVNVTLDADELVLIHNLIYNYEKSCKTDPELKPLNVMAHGFAAQIITASNLCQYGHLDSVALDRILRHHLDANSKTAARINEILQEYTEEPQE